MQICFSPEASSVLSHARDEAMRTGSYGISADHILLGILRHADNEVCHALDALGLDTKEMKEFIDSRIFSEKPVPYGDLDKIQFTRSTRNLLSIAVLEALKEKARSVMCRHLFMSILRSGESAGKIYFTESGFDYDDFLRACPRHEPGTVKETARRRAVDITGALGEQLENLLESFNNQSNTFS